MTNLATSCEPGLLDIDPAQETERIARSLREQVLGQLRRTGVVVHLSGGIDSSVTAALCVRAMGSERVLGLLTPERDASPERFALGHLVAEHLSIATVEEDISGILEAAGYYGRRDQAIRSVLPQYGPGYRARIVLAGFLQTNADHPCTVVVESPAGDTHRATLPPEAYQQLVAAAGFKERARKMLAYYHADRLCYAVAGTLNRAEFELGFFVKNGEGTADVSPIAHLYETQICRLADFLGIPEAVRLRSANTAPLTARPSREELSFSLPYDTMDLCLYGRNQQIPAEELAGFVGRPAAQVKRVYQDIDAKRAAARYLHAPPLLLAEPAVTG